MGYDEWNCPKCTYLHTFSAQRCQMCGSLRVTKNQMRDFVLGKNIKSSSSSVGSGSNQVQLSTAADATNDNISQDTGNRKRPIEIDDYDEAKCPSK
eukprot:scaffold50719_cov76-Cyclotella_meneghiniana.AAC.1